MSPQEIKIIFFLERQLNYQNIKSQVTKITRKRPEVTRSIPHNKKHPPRISMTLDCVLLFRNCTGNAVWSDSAWRSSRLRKYEKHEVRIRVTFYHREITISPRYLHTLVNYKVRPQDRQKCHFSSRTSSRNKWGLHGSLKPPRWGFNSSMSKLNNQVLFPTSEHFSNRVWTLLNKHLQPETLLNPPKTRRAKSCLLFLKRATKSQWNSLSPSLQHLLSAPNKAWK